MEYLCGTTVTRNMVQSCMQKHFGFKVELEKIQAEIFAVNQGFTSRLMKAQLTWSSESLRLHESELPSKVILKTACTEANIDFLKHMGCDIDLLPPAIRQGMQNAVYLQHENETYVYNHLASKAPIPLPLCYGAVPIEKSVHTGLIILEDLSDRASIIEDISAGLDYRQCLRAAAALADLHAWCLTTNVPWSDYFCKLQDRKELVDTVLYVGGLRPCLLAVKTEFANEFGSIDIDKIMSYLELDKFVEEMNTHHSRMDDVLVHGDFWVNNLMFQRKESPENDTPKIGDELIAVIDWQTAHKGACTTDLCRLIFSSATHLSSVEEILSVFRFYYDRLTEKAGPNRVSMSYDEMRAMFERQYAVVVLLFLAHLSLAIVLIDEADDDKRNEKVQKLLKAFRRNYDYAASVLGLA